MEATVLIPFSYTIVSALVKGLQNIEDASFRLGQLGVKSERLLSALNRISIVRQRYRNGMRAGFGLPEIAQLRQDCFRAEKEGWKILGCLAVAVPELLNLNLKEGNFRWFIKKCTRSSTTISNLSDAVDDATADIEKSISEVKDFGSNTPGDLEPGDLMGLGNAADSGNAPPLVNDLPGLMESVLGLQDTMQDLSVDRGDATRRRRGEQATTKLQTQISMLETAKQESEFRAIFSRFVQLVFEMANAYSE